MLSTHRAIQLGTTEETLLSRAPVLRRGAANLKRIGNHKGEAYQLAKAEKCERIAHKCSLRLNLTSGSRPRPTDPMNTGTPPLCSNDCRYRQKYTGFALQRNALRSELASMIEPFRCGWNIKPGMIGGDPLDYEPCNYLPENLKGVAR